jgi:hypothetical protein
VTHLSRSACRRLRPLAAATAVFALASSLAAADTSALVVWEDNVTNTTSAGGRLPAWMLAVSAADEVRRPLTRDTALYFGGEVAGDLCLDYHGLDDLTAGPHLALVQKFGLGAYAPLVRFEAAIAGLAARESARSGWNSRLALHWGRRCTEALRLDLSGEWSRTDARAEVFTKTAGGLATEVAYDFNERWRVKARVGWRNGDVVSYYRAYWTPWGWEPAGFSGYSYGYSSGPSRLVDTFDEPYLAYRLRAHTWSYAATLSPAVGPNTALVLAYEYCVTESSAARYVNQLLSAGIAHRF